MKTRLQTFYIFLLLGVVFPAALETRKTYTCTQKRCNDCPVEKYVGVNPPNWCLQNNGNAFSKQTNARWEYTCINNICRNHTYKFDSKFHDPTGGFPPDTLNIDCSYGICMAKHCLYGKCSSHKMSLNELERDIAHVPQCKDMPDRRFKRSIIASLNGWCCNIIKKWDGSISVNFQRVGKVG